MGKRKKHGYWTLKRCIKSALKFTTKTDWFLAFPGAVNSAYKNKWHKICTMHMKQGRKPNNYWTFERCQQDALLFETVTEWRRESPQPYSAAKRNKWLKVCKKHMKKCGNRISRALYSFEHPDKSVYVGLTWNYKQRYSHHMTYNTLLIQKRELGGQVFKEYGVFYSTNIVGQKEAELIEEYRANGWTILNKAEAGALGGKKPYKWTLENCITEASKYKTTTEWKNHSAASYRAARQKKWLDKCRPHMKLSTNHLPVKIKCIQTGQVFRTIKEASKVMGLFNVGEVLSGKRKDARGYTFERVT